MPDIKKDDKIDDLVAMLDNIMSNGGGHINVKVEEDGNFDVEVETTNSTEISCKEGACAQPTVFFDEDE